MGPLLTREVCKEAGFGCYYIRMYCTFVLRTVYIGWLPQDVYTANFGPVHYHVLQYRLRYDQIFEKF
jgi:hypothetical protein